jgi:GNAT superfamily N-acetyltransferase
MTADWAPCHEFDPRHRLIAADQGTSAEEEVIAVVSPTSPAGAAALRAYFADVASRYYGRSATPEEVDAALRADPSNDLAPPSGVFVAARATDTIVGCAGIRLVSERVGEVKRLFVAHHARGRGLGRRLMGELERHARDLNLTRLRLDTRSDLVEALALYAALGYEEVPAFNTGAYAEHWLAKDL